MSATLDDAKQYCLVLNSLRVPVVVETQIRTPDGAQIDLPCGTAMEDELEEIDRVEYHLAS